MCVCAHACVRVSVCEEGYSASETKPPNPGVPTSSDTPNAMQGYDAPFPGECAVLLQDVAPLSSLSA